MSLEWFARYEINFDGVAVYARVISEGKTQFVVPPVEFALVELPKGEFRQPTLQLTGPDAKGLFQALWDAGMRPNDGAGSGAEAQALKDHIKFAEKIATMAVRKVTA